MSPPPVTSRRERQCHVKVNTDGYYCWSNPNKQNVPLGQVTLSLLNGPVHGTMYNVYRDFTLLYLEKKKWVAAGHWRPLPQGDHLKSRACRNTAELGDFNEKSSPAGEPFLGHISSAVPQEIIQPSPTAKKQMACWGESILWSVCVGKSKCKDTKAKDDTNPKSTPRTTNGLAGIPFPCAFKLWPTPVISRLAQWRDLLDFSESFTRESLF